MKSQPIGLLAVAIMIVLSGCAGGKSTTAPTLSTQHVEKIQSASLFIVVRDNQLMAEIERSNVALASGAYMFGLVGGMVAAAADAAIEMKRTKEAEAFVTPLREYIKGVNLAELIQSELAPRLSSLENLHIKHTELLTQFHKKDLQQLLKKTNANAAIVIDAQVALSPDFRTIKVSTTAKLYLNGYGGGRQLFATDYSHASKVLSETENSQISLRWSENNGQLMKDDIRVGIKDVSQELGLRFAGSTQSVKEKKQESGIL